MDFAFIKKVINYDFFILLRITLTNKLLVKTISKVVHVRTQ